MVAAAFTKIKQTFVLEFLAMLLLHSQCLLLHPSPVDKALRKNPIAVSMNTLYSFALSSNTAALTLA